MMTLFLMLFWGVGFWFAGLFFDDTFDALIGRIGMDITPFQLGAMCGLVSSIIKRSTYITVREELG